MTFSCSGAPVVGDWVASIVLLAEATLQYSVYIHNTYVCMYVQMHICKKLGANGSSSEWRNE